MNPTDLDIFPPIPADTANAALLVIRNGSFYLSIGRLVNSLFGQLNLNDQSSRLQVPIQTLARLYLVTIFQFIETLTDAQAVQALQKRIDWKYALHLPLNFDNYLAIELCDFRKWLLADQARQKCLHAILARMSELTQAGRKPRLSNPNTFIIPQVCLHNRVAIVWSMISEALQALAAEQPAWLGSIYLPRWYQRYGKSQQVFDTTQEIQEQMDFAQAIGADGYYLLNALSACDFPDLQSLPEVSGLRQTWEKQYSQERGEVVWRNYDCANCPIPSRFQDHNEPIN